MGYVTLDPARLLSAGFTAPEVAESAWHTRWDADVDVADLLPPFVDFATSGSTGPARTWRRVRENVWREAGMLAALISADRPGAIVSFVPSRHLFGALTSVLVPAWLGLPVWFRPSFAGAMPDVGARRVAVMATPWIFRLLRGQLAWVRRFEQVTVLYGGAMLPEDAGKFLAEAGNARIVEVLGSTEAGGIASRRWCEGAPPAWTLFPDVSFAGPIAVGEETPLSVRGPRLAFRPGELPPERWTGDDVVVPLDARTLRLVGRKGRLVKVNGRRINLDDAEHALRGILACADLALVPVTDPLIGEHVELHVVLRPGTTLAALDLAAAFRCLGVRPKRVEVLDRIERSVLGKALNSKEAEVATP